jgi:hypothetical protein
VPTSSFFYRARVLITRQWIALLALILYLPLVFTGYGSDVDTYRVLDAGRNFVASADYVPSRRPGYVVYEMAVFALDRLGGSVLANLGSVFWALVGVICFLRILRRHQVKNAGLLALILVVHPLFWYNATVTLDYVWALGMLLAGFDLIENDRFDWAGLALGLAAGCRLSSIIVAAGLFGYAWLRAPQKRLAVVIGAVLWGVLSGLAYILPWDFAEWRASFWRISAGGADLWSPLMQVGRFAYKNAYFWGFPAALMLVGLLLAARSIPAAWKNAERRRLVLLAGLVLVGSEILFWRFPIEPAYLLPTLPFWLLLVGLSERPRWVLAIFLALVLSFNFVNLNLAHPNAAGQASSAQLGVWLEPGYLTQQMHQRIELYGCDSHTCYDERVFQRPAPPESDP